MRYRWVYTLIAAVALLWLLHALLDLDPVRAGVGALVVYGGVRLVRSGTAAESEGRLTGAVHLLDHEYPLREIDLACTVADVKIDLSRAIIPPGEHRIQVRGLVGDVTIYVPYDLELSVEAAVPAGRLNLLGARRRSFVTRAYAEADRKVQIAVSLAVGDIDVRYL